MTLLASATAVWENFTLEILVRTGGVKRKRSGAHLFGSILLLDDNAKSGRQRLAGFIVGICQDRSGQDALANKSPIPLTP